MPACFIAGASDWGIYQSPGALEAMQARGCRQLQGCHILPGAGHWVQQEQPEAVAGLVLDFLQQRDSAGG
ncbi:MAG: alpha/beta hydrolase [Caldilinea sp.]